MTAASEMSDITINAKRIKLRAQPSTASGSIPCSISFLRKVFRSLPRIWTNTCCVHG